MQIWGEGLVMGEKAGLDWEVMLEVLGNSAVGSGVVKSKIPTAHGARLRQPGDEPAQHRQGPRPGAAAGAEVDVELPATKRVARAVRPGAGGWARVEGLLRGRARDGAAGRAGAQRVETRSSYEAVRGGAS